MYFMYIAGLCCSCHCINDSVDAQAVQINYVYDMDVMGGREILTSYQTAKNQSHKLIIIGYYNLNSQHLYLWRNLSYFSIKYEKG